MTGLSKTKATIGGSVISKLKTAELIASEMKSAINSRKIKVEYENKANVQIYKIIIKSDNRPDALEVVSDYLNNNNISFVEGVHPGSSFNSFEISKFQKLK